MATTGQLPKCRETSKRLVCEIAKRAQTAITDTKACNACLGCCCYLLQKHRCNPSETALLLPPPSALAAYPLFLPARRFPAPLPSPRVVPSPLPLPLPLLLLLLPLLMPSTVSNAIATTGHRGRPSPTQPRRQQTLRQAWVRQGDTPRMSIQSTERDDRTRI